MGETQDRVAADHRWGTEGPLSGMVPRSARRELPLVVYSESRREAAGGARIRPIAAAGSRQGISLWNVTDRGRRLNRHAGRVDDLASRADRVTPVEAAVAAARRLGLDVARAEVLAERSNAIVALEPAGVVARVAMDARLTNRAVPAARGAYAREVAVAGFLAQCGAPVLAPTDLVAPGPHEAGGRLVSFWPRLPTAPTANPHAAGRALRTCRAALDRFTGLPTLWLLDEAAELTRQPAVTDVLGPRAPAVAEQLEHERQALADWPLVPVHGDAGLSNAVEADGRVIWLDWEDAMQAPELWDAACLAATPLVFDQRDRALAALRAAGVDPADPALRRLIRVRVLQIVPWSALLVARRGRPRARLDQRLAWLETHSR
jgi:hypothetical protein